MSRVYLPSKCTSMEPVEAIIELYNDNYCIQQIVNTFLSDDEYGYGKERIRNLLLIYKQLCYSGEYQSPTDVELEETCDDFPNGTYEPCKVFIQQELQTMNAVEAIIWWYEKGISISNMISSLEDECIENYNTRRIQNIIKIYKRLKKEKRYSKIADIELEETNSRESAKAPIAATKPSATTTKPAEQTPLKNDPLPIFNELQNHVTMVAQGLTAALLVTGPGGIGKSYSVQQVLAHYGTEKKDFVIMKGRCTPSAMYNFLYKNYDKICVFDDCDSVLCDKEGISVLKGALDSGRSREIAWNTSGANMVDTFDCETHEQVQEKLEKWSKRHAGKIGIPTQFQFEGSVIFISNMTRQEILSKDSALITRCSVVDIQVTSQQVLTRLDALLPNFKIYDVHGKNIAQKKIKQEVFEWIRSDEFLENPRMEGKCVDFRMFIKAYKARYAQIPQWKEMAYSC